MTYNPRRPHAYQIHDSTFDVRACGAKWAVVEYYTVLDRHSEKDDRDVDVAWFDTKPEAEAERDRRTALCNAAP